MSDQADSAQSALAMVSRICTEWPTLTLEDFHELLTPDCLYINMPMPQGQCVGPDQTFKLLDAFVSGWAIDMRILHIQGDDKAILTERAERFVSRTDAGKVVDLHVMGAFEIRDGKIAHWRDYFDSRESSALSSWTTGSVSPGAKRRKSASSAVQRNLQRPILGNQNDASRTICQIAQRAAPWDEPA